MVVMFFEKKRRKAWFGKTGEDEVCWEQWTLDVTLATPRTESGLSSFYFSLSRLPVSAYFLVCKIWLYGLLIRYIERAKVHKAMEQMLLKAAMKIVTTVNREKDHIPPITTSESNPFPYQIIVNPKDNGWGARMGIF